MADMIEFFIPCVIVAKQGDRSMIAGKAGSRWIRHYTPSAVKANANELARLMAPYRPVVPLCGPIRLEILAGFPWRKSESKSRRLAGCQPKDTKPDADNIAKQVCDVLQRSGFFANDSQIASLLVSKVWCDAPGLQVVISKVL